MGALAVVALLAVAAVFISQRGSDDAAADVPGFSAVQMVSPTTVFAGGRSSIIRSDDSGRTWTAQPLTCSGCSGTLRVSDIDMLSATEGWAATSLGLFKTTDGARWTEQPTGQNRKPAIVDFVSAQDGWIVTASRSTGKFATLTDAVVAKTNDGGETWTPIQGVPPDVQGLCFSNRDDGWLATRTAAYHSADGGTTWTVALQGATAQSDQGNTTLQCTAPGEAWVEYATGSAGASVSAWTLGVIADGGQRWMPVAAPGAAGGTDAPPFAVIDPFNAFLVEPSANGQSVDGVFVSSSGASGQRMVITSILENGVSFAPAAVSFADKDHGVLVGRADSKRPSIYTTIDGGASWAPATAATDSPITKS